MCGLAGIVIKDATQVNMELIKSVFSLLMLRNDSRGGHSFGVWGKGVPPFRSLGEYEDSMDYMRLVFQDFKIENGAFLFGHTRFATHGEKTVANAHPFEEGNVILAHNGVVSVDGYNYKDHAVDSGRIAKAIVTHGYVEGMDKVSGSCALLLTVGGQPLVYRHNQMLSYTETPWGVVLSSDKRDISWVFDALALEEPDIKTVDENVFCQPGWGNVRTLAPASEDYGYGYGGFDQDSWRRSSTVWDRGDGHGPSYWDSKTNSWKPISKAKDGDTKTTTLVTSNESVKGGGSLGVVKLQKSETFRVDPELELLAREMEEEEAAQSEQDERVYRETVGSDWRDQEYKFEFCDRCGTETESSEIVICESDFDPGAEELICRDCISEAVLEGYIIKMICTLKEAVNAD